MHRTALLAGPTGLVGHELLSLLLDDAEIADVVVLSRRRARDAASEASPGHRLVQTPRQLRAAARGRLLLLSGHDAEASRIAGGFSQRRPRLSGEDREDGARRRSEPLRARVGDGRRSALPPLLQSHQGGSGGSARQYRISKPCTRCARRCSPARAVSSAPASSSLSRSLGRSRRCCPRVSGQSTLPKSRAQCTSAAGAPPAAASS